MKRFYFYAITLMALATAIAVVSCQKEKELQVEAEVPQADAQMQAEIDRIVGFKKQVETRKANPGTKSAETVSRKAYHGSTLPDKAYQFLTVTCTPQRDGTAELKFDGQYGSKEYNIYKVIPDTLGISLEAQNNVVPPSRYYVIDVVINGEESSNPSFIRHKTHVKYGRYVFIDENTIGQLPL